MPKAKKGERFGGRQKGAQNKVTASLKEMILASLDEVGGQSYLVDQARNNANAYITLIGKYCPQLWLAIKTTQFLLQFFN
jgi:hypothetical protein